MVELLLRLTVSDVCHGWPGLLPYAGIQGLHAVLGAAASILWLPLRLGFLFGLFVKEIVGDLRGCGYATWVAADSVADLAIVFGCCLVAGRLVRRRPS